MKIVSILLGTMLLVACDKKTHTDRDDLITEWSQDGNVMKIIRKGVTIAIFRNNSNACFIELAGPDGIADAAFSYYEDDATAKYSEHKFIVLVWNQKDGTTKSVAYDNEGNIVEPGQDPK